MASRKSEIPEANHLATQHLVELATQITADRTLPPELKAQFAQQVKGDGAHLSEAQTGRMGTPLAELEQPSPKVTEVERG